MLRLLYLLLLFIPYFRGMKLFVRSSARSDYKRWEDNKLLQHWRASRERACFDELYDRYVHLVYGTCKKALDDSQDSKDATMQVFEALLHLPREKPIHNLRSWLYVTARNTCISYYRKRAQSPVFQEDSTFFEKSAEKFMENEGLTRLLSREHPQLLDQLADALEQLEPAQAECLELFFFEERSYKSISEETGYSLKQVKSYLQNGKRKLSIILKNDLASEE